jgi:hypothetical protein
MTEEFNYPSSAVDIGVTKTGVFITNVTQDLNTVGPDHPCKRALIKAFTVNTGLVWVNFGTAAVAEQCYPLDAGDPISVPLDNTNEINCLFEVGGEHVSVIYSN